MDKSYWLIEHREAKPCPVYVQARGDFYTCDPREAKRFPTREAAENWMECMHFLPPWGAVQHGFETGLPGAPA